MHCSQKKSLPPHKKMICSWVRDWYVVLDDMIRCLLEISHVDMLRLVVQSSSGFSTCTGRAVRYYLLFFFQTLAGRFSLAGIVFNHRRRSLLDFRFDHHVIISLFVEAFDRSNK